MFKDQSLKMVCYAYKGVSKKRRKKSDMNIYDRDNQENDEQVSVV